MFGFDVVTFGGIVGKFVVGKFVVGFPVVGFPVVGLTLVDGLADGLALELATGFEVELVVGLAAFVVVLTLIGAFVVLTLGFEVVLVNFGANVFVTPLLMVGFAVVVEFRVFVTDAVGLVDGLIVVVRGAFVVLFALPSDLIDLSKVIGSSETAPSGFVKTVAVSRQWIEMYNEILALHLKLTCRVVGIRRGRIRTSLDRSSSGVRGWS